MNDGAPLALGLARSNGMGGYDSDADWVVLATMQSPSYAPFSDTQAKPSGVISYFVKKSGTTPPFIMGDINEAPSFSVTAMGMNIPLNGFIVACRYYSGSK